MTTEEGAACQYATAAGAGSARSPSPAFVNTRRRGKIHFIECRIMIRPADHPKLIFRVADAPRVGPPRCTLRPYRRSILASVLSPQVSSNGVGAEGTLCHLSSKAPSFLSDHPPNCHSASVSMAPRCLGEPAKPPDAEPLGRPAAGDSQRRRGGKSGRRRHRNRHGHAQLLHRCGLVFPGLELAGAADRPHAHH